MKDVFGLEGEPALVIDGGTMVHFPHAVGDNDRPSARLSETGAR